MCKRYSEIFRYEKKMCFLKKVGEHVLLCCEDRTCVGEHCVPRVLSACGSPEVLSAEGTDASWVMLCVLTLIILLLIIMKQLR